LSRVRPMRLIFLTICLHPGHSLSQRSKRMETMFVGEPIFAPH
jgi:hypothetical protein